MRELDRYAGADPGSPVLGGANPPAGVPTYDFVKFSQKLHEIKNMLGRRGTSPLEPPLVCLNCTTQKSNSEIFFHT